MEEDGTVLVVHVDGLPAIGEGLDWGESDVLGVELARFQGVERHSCEFCEFCEFCELFCELCKFLVSVSS